MPKKTYTQINSITLAASASSVTFSNIPATPYRDLIVIVNGTSSTTAVMGVRFNGDTTTSCPAVDMIGDGVGRSSGASSATYAYVGYFFTNPSYSIANILDYMATDKHKTVLGRGSAAGNQVVAHSSRWPSTNAVTSVTCLLSTGTFSSGSTFTLYGIEA